MSTGIGVAPTKVLHICAAKRTTTETFKQSLSRPETRCMYLHAKLEKFSTYANKLAMPNAQHMPASWQRQAEI